MRIDCRLLAVSLILILSVQIASAATQISVTETKVQPEVFMKGDTGTVTLVVTNSGNSAVYINRAILLGGTFGVLSDPYPVVGWLGAGNSISFTFTLRAGNEEGLFYPRFILEMSDGTTLRYVIPVQVENSDLILSVIKKPDYVNIGKTATYSFEIGNPRPNAVNSVQVIPEGQGFQVTPTRYFIGNLDSDSTARVSFDVVPERVTQLRFKVLFKNGMNEHQFSIMVPIVPSENKKAAEIQLTNIAIVQEGDRFRLTGDVCNVGLERANAVIIKTEDPAIPVDPFRTYIVGTLEPDDFSSFELTFKASGNARIPVIAEYKDDEGNRISSITFVDISVAQFIESGSQPSTIGLILVWVLVIVVIVAIVYSWRRR